MDISYSEFLTFLRENHCESQFTRAFHDQNGCHFMDEGLWNLLAPDETFFCNAFTWADTAEGREYWRKIDDLWFERYAPKL